MGSLERQLGRPASARALQELALAAARDVRDRRMEIAALQDIGLTHLDEDARDAAASFFEQALEVVNALPDRSVQLSLLCRLGKHLIAAGRSARPVLERARRIAAPGAEPASEAAVRSLADLEGAQAAFDAGTS